LENTVKKEQENDVILISDPITPNTTPHKRTRLQPPFSTIPQDVICISSDSEDGVDSPPEKIKLENSNQKREDKQKDDENIAITRQLFVSKVKYLPPGSSIGSPV
jgi:hypothetical protein